MPTLTEDQIRTLALIAKEELGDQATYERLHEVVRRAVQSLENLPPGRISPEVGNRFLVICLTMKEGENALVLSEGLKDSGVVIQDRFERRMGGFQVLLAVVHRGNAKEDFTALRERLAQAGEKHGVKILVQMEEGLVTGKR